MASIVKVILCAKIFVLLGTTDGFLLSKERENENVAEETEVVRQSQKHKLFNSFLTQEGMAGQEARKLTGVVSDRLPISFRRRRRDLGGTTDPFGRSSYKWKLKPGKPKTTSTTTNLLRRDSPNLTYNYQFWGEKFSLQGNVTVVQYERKLRVIFSYKISGIANATMNLVRQNLKNPSVKWPEESAQKPRSCRFQLSENRTTLIRNSKCSQPLRRAAPLKNPPQPSSDKLSFDTENELDFQSDELSPRGVPQDECAPQRVTSFRQTWLCIDPELPPCFLLTVQDENYKVAETICPKRLPNRQMPTQKLYSGFW